MSGDIADTPAAAPTGVDHLTRLTGAGATFPYPLYQKWFETFHARYPQIELHYDPAGSEAGIARLQAGALDFAGSDVMIGADEYYAGGKPKFLRFLRFWERLFRYTNASGYAERASVYAGECWPVFISAGFANGTIRKSER